MVGAHGSTGSSPHRTTAVVLLLVGALSMDGRTRPPDLAAGRGGARQQAAVASIWARLVVWVARVALSGG